jgi:hypothetical protein
MAAAGFKVVANSGNLYGTASEVLAWADKANSLGMKIIWDMSVRNWYDGSSPTPLDEFGWLKASCNCSTRDGFARYVVNLVKNHPATMAYYIADEPDPFTNPRLTVSQVENYANVVRSADPTHPTALVHWYQYWDCTIRLRPFVNAADWLALDIYPISQRRPVSDVANCAAAGQQLVNVHPGKKWWAVAEAFRHLNGGWDPRNGVMPTRYQMRQMRDAFLNNSSPAVLMWWWYPDASSTAKGWSDLVWAAGL